MFLEDMVVYLHIRGYLIYIPEQEYNIKGLHEVAIVVVI